MSDTDKRPLRAAVLAILALLSFVAAGIHMLQMLHGFPIDLGPANFYGLASLGAILWAMAGLAWVLVARLVWTLQPLGWLYAVALATLNLLLAVVSIEGQSAFSAMQPAILLNTVTLFFALLPGTKMALGVPQ